MSATVVDESLVAPPGEGLPIPVHLQKAWSVLVRGLRESPALRTGLGFTVIVSLAAAVANPVAPFLIQQIFDHGFRGGFRPGFVFGICGASFALIAGTHVARRARGPGSPAAPRHGGSCGHPRRL